MSIRKHLLFFMKYFVVLRIVMIMYYFGIYDCNLYIYMVTGHFIGKTCTI